MVIQVTANIQSDNEHDLFNVTDYNQEFKDTLCGQNVTMDDATKRCDCRGTDYVGVQCLTPRKPCDKSACGFASDCTNLNDNAVCTCIPTANHTVDPNSNCFKYIYDKASVIKTEYTPPFKGDDGTRLPSRIEMSFILEYTAKTNTSFNVAITDSTMYSNNDDAVLCTQLYQYISSVGDVNYVIGSQKNLSYTNETGNGTVTVICKYDLSPTAILDTTGRNIPFKIISAGFHPTKCSETDCNGFSAGCVKIDVTGSLVPHCFPMPNYELNTASHTFETTTNCNNSGYPLIKNGQPGCDCSLIPEFTGSNCSDVQPLCTGIRNPCAYDSTFCRVNQTTENSYCECNRNYTAFNDGTQTQLFGGDTCEIQYNYLQGKHGK
jgi:hypothetical protein